MTFDEVIKKFRTNRSIETGVSGNPIHATAPEGKKLMRYQVCRFGNKIWKELR